MAKLTIPWRVRNAWERIQLRRPRFSAPLEVIRVSDRSPQASLVAMGDLALHRTIGDAIERFGPEYPLEPLLPLLAGADLRVGNLETVLSSKGSAVGGLGSRIRAQPAAIETLVRGGFDVVTVANNHCLDFGPDALLDSLRQLREHGIASTGAGTNVEEARAPAIIERNGIRIGLLGYCDDYIRDGRVRTEVEIAESRHDWILRDLAALRPSVDVVVLQLHWGYEFQLYPMLGHRDRARRYAEAGADLVLCHHAHVPMGVERWGAGVIAHGLGNGVFSRTDYMRGGHPLTSRAFALEVEFDKAGVTRARLHPTALRAGGRTELLAGRDRDRMLRLLGEIGRGLENERRLAGIEEDRTFREATGRVARLVALAKGADSGLAEAVAALRLPRQRELIERLLEGPQTSAMGELLRAAAEAPENAAAAAIALCAGAEEEAAACQARLRASPLLPGRVP